MESVASAEADRERAARLVQQNLQFRRERRQDPCPLCGEPASILDWRPSLAWLAVDDCQCDGFFVSTALLDTRLPSLSTEDRATLSARIRSVRKTRREAWLICDDTPARELVIRDDRPDRTT